MLRSPVFYVLYVMFVLIAAGGLTMAASMAPIAKDLQDRQDSGRSVRLHCRRWCSRLSLNRIFDGVGRPFFGWLSDQIGRENTMALAFLIGAGALFTLSQSGTNPVVFVLVTAIYFGVYGEIFSLFPATQGDTFGAKFAAANAGMLYTAKGTGSLLVPIAAAIAKSHGWGSVFTIFVSFQRPRGAAGAVRAEADASPALCRRPRERAVRRHARHRQQAGRARPDRST